MAFSKSRYILILAGFTFFLSSCASAPTPGPTYISPVIPPGLPGDYHRVEAGQTLWRIARLYNVDIDTLISTNHIPDAAKIETGQLIFIPHHRQTAQSAGGYVSEDFIWPLRGQVVAVFGQVYNDVVNKGIEIRATQTTVILAARRGKVVFYSPDFKSFGKTIILDHLDGFSTVYSGVGDVLAAPGDTVEKGAGIARGSYLHFEIRKRHSPQNPYFYLP